MRFLPPLSRRGFVRSASLAAAGLATSPALARKPSWLPAGLAGFNADQTSEHPLEEFAYGDVELQSELHNQQLEQTHSVLIGLSEDGLIKPFRQMSGKP